MNKTDTLGMNRTDTLGMNRTDSIMEMTAAIKADSFRMAALSLELRNRALSAIAAALEAEADKIFAANEKDLARAQAENQPAPLLKRLRFDRVKLDECLAGINSLLSLPDPLFRTLLKRELDSDLILHKVTCPIGVIGVIFESRPGPSMRSSPMPARRLTFRRVFSHWWRAGLT